MREEEVRKVKRESGLVSAKNDSRIYCLVADQFSSDFSKDIVDGNWKVEIRTELANKNSSS